MTAADLRNELAQGRTDYEFVYKNKRGSICPFNKEDGSLSAHVAYGGKYYDSSTLDELMNLKFLDGKSLNEVAEDVGLCG